MDESPDVLRDLPLLAFLPPQMKNLVVDSFVAVVVPFGGVIVREGESADAFYVLASGKARVLKNGANGAEIALNVLRPGDSFGERGLLEKTNRSATVRASSDVELYRLDRSVFQALVKTNPEIEDSLRLEIKKRGLNDFFRLHSPFARLPIEALRTLVEELETVAVEPGTLVIRAGDEAGPLFVVEEGRLRVFTENAGQRRYRNYLRKGDFFGELSLFKRCPRTASVEAVSPCRLLRFTPRTFQKLLDSYPAFKARIEARIAQYDYKEIARVPLDFADESLPAEAGLQEKVGPSQVDPVVEEGKDPARPVAEPFASPEGRFVREPRTWRRFPHVYQVDEMDCGAACLAMICRAFGRNVSLTRIRQLVHTGLDGTGLRALCRAAAELGIASRAVKTRRDNLAHMPLPAIIHWEGNHWVVLYDVDPEHVFVADPALGMRRLTRAEFEKKWTGYAALFDVTPAFSQAPEGRSVLAWLGPIVRPFSGVLIQALALALLAGALRLALPLFLQPIVDRGLVEKDVASLPVLLSGMAVILVLLALVWGDERFTIGLAATRIDAAVFDLLTRKLLALPIGYFLNRRAGDLVRRLSASRQLRDLLVRNGLHAFSAGVQAVLAIGLMFAFSRPLALVFLVSVPLYLLLALIWARWLQPALHALDEALGKYQFRQTDVVRGIETIKLVAAEDAVQKQLMDEFQELARRRIRADGTALWKEGSVQLLAVGTLFLCFWIGLVAVTQERLSAGSLAAFVLLTVLANNAVGTLLALWGDFQLTSVLLHRLHDVIEQEPEQGEDRSRLKPVPTLEGAVRCQNVAFQYGGTEAPLILEGITLEVPAGTRVAVVGRSGAGKTTLVKCLAGLLEPTHGTVYYDGVDRKTLNVHDLRRQFGVVLQENYFFNDTIAGNIAFGAEAPEMERVLRAARDANAHAFIERLPLGYETRIGETGLSLSRGQRQRLALARALYRQPAILILDEASAGLDAESEQAVQEILGRLFEGRTVFAVAHHPAAGRDADLILVLEKGKIVEQGTHEELMQLQGLYFYLSSQRLEV